MLLKSAPGNSETYSGLRTIEMWILKLTLLKQSRVYALFCSELFQLTGKGTGLFIYPLPIHHCLRAESRDSGLSCLCPQCAPTGRKRPFSRELQVSSEFPEFWMNVRGHELVSDSFCSSFFFCSRSHQPMRDPLSLRSPRDLMPPRLSVTPLVLFTYISLAPGTVVDTQ